MQKPNNFKHAVLKKYPSIETFDNLNLAFTFGDLSISENLLTVCIKASKPHKCKSKCLDSE